jgi:dihydroorotate dehydrogenase
MTSSHEIPVVKRLSGPACIRTDLANGINQDFHRSLHGWWPEDLATYLLEQYKVDIRARYAGRPIDNPFGKGSGQLSMTTRQIAEAAEAGLGFVVLKTVIAQDESGHQSMAAWAIPEARMVVEPIHGSHSGREGWTVTWKGRGWSRSFTDYLDLFKESLEIAKETGMVVAPSVKFHLPAGLDEPWRLSEYEYVLKHLAKIWQEAGFSGHPMPIEKDFSPTLAGDDRARQQAVILRWLEEIVQVLRKSSSIPITIGLKIMNSLGPISFQQDLFKLALNLNSPADYFIYANRLFDAERIFEGHRGVAFGGPDLSDRNLYVMDQCCTEIKQAAIEISGTGDVDSGRSAVEYALRGCQSVQLHTFFQTPEMESAGSGVKRLRRKLAKLVFDPADGLVAWLLHARSHWGLIDADGVSKWIELPAIKTDQLHLGD